MVPVTPATWVEMHASETPDAPALSLADGEVSYAQLAVLVRRRVESIDAPGDVVTAIVVRNDLASIVEILATQVAGGCAMPVAAPIAQPTGRPREGHILALRTSGSSGTQKVVPLTMANISSSAAASRMRLGTGYDDRWLACLPFNHIGGLSVLFRSFEAGGCAVVAPFDGAIGGIIDDLKPTTASMVPTMVHRLLASNPDGLAQLRWVLTGGASTTRSLLESATSHDVLLVQTFGMTEAASQVASVVPGEPSRHAGYVGHPLEGTIATAPGGTPQNPVAISIDGPTVFDGYLNGPIREGPFQTSDVGWFDDQGGLTVAGRLDDTVITGGVNVSLRHIEDALCSIEDVRDAVVVAIGDEEWGQRVCAMVATDLGIAELRRIMSGELDDAEVPRSWLTRGDLPLLSNGKHDIVAVRRAFER
ncbi:MAG: class I adenylate-forming enzyme family protein [Acidimicrobiia bacterium]